MNIKILLLATALIAATGVAADTASSPQYDRDHLLLPQNYREWIYLSSGFDMSYSAMPMPGHHMFDNVFVQPEAYQYFVKNGTWPDKTVLVLEARGAQGKGSINQHGNYQGTEVMAREIHVKDAQRFEGGWAFFRFEGTGPGELIPRSAECYSCHAKNAAVDTTFVQFYPTLLPLATAKGTLSPHYEP
jgi:hypothetical protein